MSTHRSVPSNADTTRTRDHGGTRELRIVAAAEFRSYYGRPVLKTPVWEWMIPSYLFTGGLAAGSAVLAAGADATGRPGLRRVGRLGSLAALTASTALLIGDLGQPARFHHMLRVVKPTSPMSIGTWILTAFSPGSGIAAIDELMPRRFSRTAPGRLLHRLARPSGMFSALVAPGLASYTAVLLSHTAVPAWNDARELLPFVFTGSAAASAGGLGIAFAPVDEAAPARWFAICGATTELTASRLMENRLGLTADAYRTGRAHHLRRGAELLTAAGLVGALLGRRNRAVAGTAGLALAAGSALQRFGVYAAGVASAKDPKYTVVPQRSRLARTPRGV
jgi:Polysulphide reductase, NrfD